MVYGYKEFMRAFRKGDYKLIEYYVNDELNKQLFNVNKDTYEKNNLFEQKELYLKYTEMKEEMIQKM